jgi:hypothetical protein
LEGRVGLPATGDLAKVVNLPPTFFAKRHTLNCWFSQRENRRLTLTCCPAATIYSSALYASSNAPTFLPGNCTTRFMDEKPELFEFTPRRDRATKLPQYIGDVIVNGQVSVRDALRATRPIPAQVPRFNTSAPLPEGTRDKFRKTRQEVLRLESRKPTALCGRATLTIKCCDPFKLGDSNLFNSTNC